MKYAVISDLHANESALRRVLADAKSHGADRVVCLGDIVGYGPLPAETLALARKSCVATVAGNHDDAVCGRHGDDTFTGLARDAVRRHREALQPADIAWLKSLPYTCEFGRAVAAHGDLFDPQKFYYVENESDAAATFDATDAQLVFVGHTHVPAIFLVGRSGNVYKTEPQDFTLEDGKRYIVNPGSVGYPRESGGKCFRIIVTAHSLVEVYASVKIWCGAEPFVECSADDVTIFVVGAPTVNREERAAVYLEAELARMRDVE